MPDDKQVYRERIARMTVLVVDAFFDFRQVLHAMLLNEIGVSSVQDARSVKVAMEMLKEKAFDLVIADTAMEPVGAIELAKLIRSASNGVDPKTPIIAVSGRPHLDDILAARDAGVDEYLAKPLSAKILQLRIHSIIQHPRPFVCADAFVGPDRRRHGEEGFQGEDRRHETPEMIVREG